MKEITRIVRHVGTFLRGVLDKVGVQPEVVRIGKFKSAGDQLLRSDMSVGATIQCYFQSPNHSEMLLGTKSRITLEQETSVRLYYKITTPKSV